MLHQYGLIAVDTKGGATQLEKVTYDTAMAYLPQDVVRRSPEQMPSATMMTFPYASLVTFPQKDKS